MGVTVDGFLSGDSGYRGVRVRGGASESRAGAGPCFPPPFPPPRGSRFSAGLRTVPRTNLRTLLPSADFILSPLQAKSAASAHLPVPQHFQLKSP